MHEPRLAGLDEKIVALYAGYPILCLDALVIKIRDGQAVRNVDTAT